MFLLVRHFLIPRWRPWASHNSNVSDPGHAGFYQNMHLLLYLQVAGQDRRADFRPSFKANIPRYTALTCRGCRVTRDVGRFFCRLVRVHQGSHPLLVAPGNRHVDKAPVILDACEAAGCRAGSTPVQSRSSNVGSGIPPPHSRGPHSGCCGWRPCRNCSIPDDHIDPRRSALFMARSVLREARDGDRTC